MKKQTPIIKNAEHKDINQLVPLLKQLFSIEKDFKFDTDKHTRGLKLMLDGCGKHRVVKTAWVDNKIVGMCTAQIRISTASGNISACLEDLVVDGQYRGCGIGTALLDAMESWAETMGITAFTLLADQNNAPALAFYQAKKWNQTRMICLSKQLP